MTEQDTSQAGQTGIPLADKYVALRAENDGDYLAQMGTDAATWGAEFAARFGVNVDDARAWFANAIGAGTSDGHNMAMNAISETAKKLGVDLTEVWTPAHAFQVAYDIGHPKFQDAQELDDYLHLLNDAGLEPQVALLDAKKILWVTYGEEHSSGGEASVHHLLNGDPRENFAPDPDPEDSEPTGPKDFYYVAVPLDFAAYPLTLLYSPSVA